MVHALFCIPIIPIVSRHYISLTHSHERKHLVKIQRLLLLLRLGPKEKRCPDNSAIVANLYNRGFSQSNCVWRSIEDSFDCISLFLSYISILLYKNRLLYRVHFSSLLNFSLHRTVAVVLRFIMVMINVWEYICVAGVFVSYWCFCRFVLQNQFQDILLCGKKKGLNGCWFTVRRFRKIMDDFVFTKIS